MDDKSEKIKKYSLEEIREHIEAGKAQIGKVLCTHKINIARAMIEFNRSVDFELGCVIEGEELRIEKVDLES